MSAALRPEHQGGETPGCGFGTVSVMGTDTGNDRVARVDVDGMSVAYRERVDGPPLVLLHGWPLDSREWQRQLHGLSDEFRVV